MVYLYFSTITLFNAIRTVLDKYFQKGYMGGIKSAAVYNLVNAIYGTICFWIMGGLRLDYNTKTLIFSVIYAASVVINHISVIYTMARVSVAVSAITYTAGTMLIPAIFGVLFLNEPISVKVILSLIIMLIAVIVPYLKNPEKKLSFGDIIICGIYFINCGILIIIAKLYAICDGVCSSTSFYCLTNIVIAVASFIAVIAYCSITHESFFKSMQIFNLRSHINILSRNVLADIGAVITIIILTVMDVSLYTVIVSSLSLICSSLVSRFYFKERFTASNTISVLLAIVALILCL